MLRRRCQLVGLSMVASSALAHASPTATLEYSRNVQMAVCPDEDALRALIAARLGYDPIRPSASTRLRAEIVERGDKLRAHVEVHDASGAARGSRDLTSPVRDCEELASSLALAIAIAIDPLNLGRPPAPAAPPPATESAVTAATPAVASLPAEPERSERPLAPAPREPVHFRAGLGVLSALGASPSVSAGGQLFVGARWRWVSLDAEARVDAPTSTDGPSVNGGPARGAVTSWLVLGTLAPCVHFGAFFGCPLVSLGSIRAKGSGVDLGRHDAGLYAGAGARGGAELFFSRVFGIRAHADLLVTATRVTLYLNDRSAWTSPLLSPSLGVDAIAQLP